MVRTYNLLLSKLMSPIKSIKTYCNYIFMFTIGRHVGNKDVESVIKQDKTISINVLVCLWTKLRCRGCMVPLVFGKLLWSPSYLLKSEQIRSFEILIYKSKIFLLFTLKSIFLLFIFEYYAIIDYYEIF